MVHALLPDPQRHFEVSGYDSDSRTADTDVPDSLSKDMDARLGKAGVAHKFMPVEGGEHRLAGATPEELSRVAGRAVEFLKTNTA